MDTIREGKVKVLIVGGAVVYVTDPPPVLINEPVVAVTVTLYDAIMIQVPP
jgi:hypothetical protein